MENLQLCVVFTKRTLPLHKNNLVKSLQNSLQACVKSTPLYGKSTVLGCLHETHSTLYQKVSLKRFKVIDFDNKFKF